MTDNLLEQLKHVDPLDTNAVRRRVPPTERLIEILGSEPMSEPPRRHRLRVRGVVLAAAATAAIVALASSLPGRGGAAPEAASALESVAAIASAEAAPGTAGDISYYRTVSSLDGGSFDGRRADPFAWQQQMTTEDWVASDGSGRRRTIVGEIEFADGQDERDWRASGSPRLGPAPGTITDTRFGPGELNGVPYEGGLPRVSELPANADALEGIFRNEHARSSASVPVDAKLFEYAASVLLSTGSRPDLRAAVYELLARIDGVQLVDEVEDPLGRDGTGVSLDIDYSGAPTKHTVIFDSETSYPLAYTEEPIPPAPDHLVITMQPGYIALAGSGQVRDLGTRP